MKLLFGGLIAIILLGLYEYSVYEGIAVVTCISTPGCTAYNATSFAEGYAHAMSGIGGLVSALVIAELAITEPGQAPVARAVGGAGVGPKLGWTLTIVTTLYLLVWVIAGLAAYVVGTMWYPGKLQPLTDLGQSWLGLAVAAAYAYFGISPKQP
jgi:phage shock protein PspC (stress-responsive transcriptional regulator)